MEDIDVSLQDLYWIWLKPGGFPLDGKDTGTSTLLHSDDLGPTSRHTSVEQPSIDHSIGNGLPSPFGQSISTADSQAMQSSVIKTQASQINAEKPTVEVSELPYLLSTLANLSCLSFHNNDQQ
jgi:hypothetical protein